MGRAITAAVVGERGLEGEGVALEQAELGGRDVGHDADDDVDLSFERAWERVEEIAFEDLDAVGACTGDGACVDLARDDGGSRTAGAEHRGDRAGPGAEVNGSATAWWETFRGTERQLLALP